MRFLRYFVLVYVATMAAGAVLEEYFQHNRQLARVMVEALQDQTFEREVLHDLMKENQLLVNRTMALVVKYIVKREVDNYRSHRTDAISRRVYSSLIMKLIDIAKDLPRNSSYSSRIETAHRYYMSVETRDLHDAMADIQVFHACARLYEVLYTAPRILTQLGSFEDLTPKILVKKLDSLQVKPEHLGALLLIQYYLQDAVNFALRVDLLSILSTKPAAVGQQVVEALLALAAHLLPLSELLDLHLAHTSPVFEDTCPKTWLGIVNNKPR